MDNWFNKEPIERFCVQALLKTLETPEERPWPIMKPL